MNKHILIGFVYEKYTNNTPESVKIKISKIRRHYDLQSGSGANFMKLCLLETEEMVNENDNGYHE